MKKLFLLPLLALVPGAAFAAPAKSKAPAATKPAAPKPAAKPAPASPKDAKALLEKIGVGELRLDGKISALLGDGVWQLEAASWTSPRGVTTDFEDLKTKGITVSPKAFIHPLGDPTPVALKEVKLGSHVAVIGKPGAEGSVVAREVVLLEGYGAHKEVGSLLINPFSLKLIDQSRSARENGQLPKALGLAQQAVSAAQGIGDLSGEALATQDMAGLYADLKQPDRALSSFQRVQALGERIGNSLAQVLGLMGQGRMLAASGKTDASIQLFERAVALSATTPTELQISALSTLAAVYLATSKRTEGVGALTRLFPLEDGSDKRDEATNTLLTLAALLAKTETATARGYLDQARPRLEFARDDTARLNLTLSLATALKALGDADAPAQYEVAAKLAEAKGDTARAAKIRALATKTGDPLEEVVPGATEKQPAQGDTNNGAQNQTPEG